jgi:cytochrome c oxidase assembly protein subunit 15
MTAPAPVDLSPGATIAAIGALIAVLLLAFTTWRRRHSGGPARPGAQLQAITLLTLFLTFDLVVFGAYTRLSDSGLGCPDWPGCYASASPVGAHPEIKAAEAAMPTGPVTQSKAWIEMVHRYLATAVGALITAIMVASWWQRWRAGHSNSAAWATLCFVWVCVQGAFGALTVTMKLYPAIVTLHLLGGIGLLALLAVLATRGMLDGEAAASSAVKPAAGARRSEAIGKAVVPPRRTKGQLGWTALQRGLLIGLFLLLLAQVTLGGWVSTNYAVLACSDFPTCHGRWWPEADFTAGYAVLRDLGRQADGSLLANSALTAIHLGHRLGALVLVGAALLAGWWLRGASVTSWQRRTWLSVLALLVLQVLTGVSNVVLGWPLLAALAHTGGAAALLALLAALLTRAPAGAVRTS